MNPTPRSAADTKRPSPPAPPPLNTGHINRIQLVALQLRNLCDSSNDFKGAAVLTRRDGFIVHSLLPKDVSEEVLCGLSAAMLGAGENLADQLLETDMERVFLQTPRGYILVHAVDDTTVLILLVNERARLGHVFLEVGRAAKALAKIMAASPSGM